MSRAELDALPVGAVVETGGGLQYRRLPSGKWQREDWTPIPSACLTDPEHSRQPIRRVS